jgi:hypothetical protein
MTDPVGGTDGKTKLAHAFLDLTVALVVSGAAIAVAHARKLVEAAHKHGH